MLGLVRAACVPLARSLGAKLLPPRPAPLAGSGVLWSQNFCAAAVAVQTADPPQPPPRREKPITPREKRKKELIKRLGLAAANKEADHPGKKKKMSAKQRQKAEREQLIAQIMEEHPNLPRRAAKRRAELKMVKVKRKEGPARQIQRGAQKKVEQQFWMDLSYAVRTSSVKRDTLEVGQKVKEARIESMKERIREIRRQEAMARGEIPAAKSGEAGEEEEGNKADEKKKKKATDDPQAVNPDKIPDHVKVTVTHQPEITWKLRELEQMQREAELKARTEQRKHAQGVLVRALRRVDLPVTKIEVPLVTEPPSGLKPHMALLREYCAMRLAYPEGIQWHRSTEVGDPNENKPIVVINDDDIKEIKKNLENLSEAARKHLLNHYNTLPRQQCRPVERAMHQYLLANDTSYAEARSGESQSLAESVSYFREWSQAFRSPQRLLPYELDQRIRSLLTLSMRNLRLEAERLSDRYRGLSLTAPMKALLEVDTKQKAGAKDTRSSHIAYTDRQAQAYLAFRMPSIFHVCCRVFHEIEARRGKRFHPMKMLDFGSGPGTAIWAAYDTWYKSGGREMKYTAVEPSIAMISLARSLLRGLVDVHWESDAGVCVKKLGEHDVVVSTYVFVEIPTRDQFLSHLNNMWTATTDLLVLIEPGTPLGFECIRDARHWMLTNHSANCTVLAPCPHSNPRCSMDKPELRGKTWCHFGQKLNRTDFQLGTKRTAELNYETERFSYVVFQRSPTAKPLPRDPAPPSPKPPNLSIPDIDKPKKKKLNPPGRKKLTARYPFADRSRALPRITREPRLHSGHVTFDTCNADGTLKVRLVTRKTKASYMVARKLEWGDLWPEAVEAVDQRRLAVYDPRIAKAAARKATRREIEARWLKSGLSVEDFAKAEMDRELKELPAITPEEASRHVPHAPPVSDSELSD